MCEKYRTSKRINFATDEWGAEEGVTHIELKIGELSWFIDFERDAAGNDVKVSIMGFIDTVTQTASNVIEIVPWIPKAKRKGVEREQEVA
jgi:hypothetical protein